MKIYSMTATFGSLEHKTLTLKPGLNIIEAPNEWGKSTWCAFLVNMLYGLDTHARSTKTAVADKERYAPWSGLPMTGRIDLNWNGRDITIERRSKGRLVFGEFSAYETATGLEIPELDGNNCGTKLLGVERSAFTRAGFLKLTDLPVTQDEALRRRLNSLVTTGDESGAGDKLYQALKDLKNKCRFNRTGLLPQAEAQRDQLETQLHELTLLSQQSEVLTNRQKELRRYISQLENHAIHLQYAASLDGAEKVAAVQKSAANAQQVYCTLCQHCEGLPSLQTAEDAVKNGQYLQQEWIRLQTQGSALPPLPQAPQVPSYYESMSGSDAVAAAKEDCNSFATLEKKRKSKIAVTAVLSACLGIGIAAAAALSALNAFTLIPIVAFAAALVTFTAVTSVKIKKAKQALFDRHGNLPADRWEEDAARYADAMSVYESQLAESTALRGDLDSQITSLNEKIADYAKDSTLQEQVESYQQICKDWEALGDAKREWEKSQEHLSVLKSMVKVVAKPATQDSLTFTQEETDTALNAARFELHELQQKLGQAQGRSEALGQETLLRSQLRAVQHRIHKLEDTYEALEHAQKALASATSQLQRRFAPRISKRTQALFSKLTGNRYDRLTLSEDFSLNASTAQEDTLRPASWRSDGTVDQLYLALRLAVAEELTPDAPLILDDALVRFDDQRLTAALDILQETAQNKQVIVFTCQGRENALLGANS